MASQALLAATDVEEALSVALVRAIAARAGFATGIPDVDREGIDLTIYAGGHIRPRIDVQIKATINPRFQRGAVTFDLKRRNYDLLRGPTMVPRLLILVVLPPLETDWLSSTDKQLTIRRCGYWVSLADAPDRDNTSTVAVRIPTRNLLTARSLHVLMQRSRDGATL